MKNNINANSYNNNIYKKTGTFIVFILLMLSIIISTAYSVEEQISRYEFEESGGSVIIDSSGNGFHAIGYSTSHVTSPARWGDRSLEFDGSSDYVYVDTIPADTINANDSISIWIYPVFGFNAEQVIFLIEDSVTPNLETGLTYVPASGNLKWWYTDTGLTQRQETIASSVITSNQWNHIVINVDLIGNYVELYIDSIYMTRYNLTYQIYTTPSTVKEFFMGADITGSGYEFSGYMDEFRTFNTIINSSQVNSLFNDNTISFISGEIDINQTSISDIILYQSPINGQNVTNIISIDAILNYKSDCDIYIDNEIVKTYEDTNGFGYETSLDLGLHSYFLYCQYYENNTLMYELSDVNVFNVVAGDPSTINFIITGLDYEPNDESLYLVTPCPKHITTIGDIGEEVNQDFNKDKSFYFQELNDRQASFSLSSESHEFCLVNGLIQYDENNFTNDFNINKIYGMARIGVINVPSNVTESYTIETELLDIYDKSDPKAYGQTWSGILSGLILLMLGILVLAGGISANNGKITIGGVLLVLAGMGVSFTGLLGVLI